MELATHQRKLLGLLRSTYQIGPEDDDYIRTVSESRDLAEARRNIFLWRVYVLERTAALTFALLKRKQLLKDALNTFVQQRNISPFRETQAPAFLESLGAHPDPLVRSVAEFELALLKVRGGDVKCYTIAWAVEPHGILNGLARGLALEDAREGAYQILVSRDLPHFFQIMSEEDASVGR